MPKLLVRRFKPDTIRQLRVAAQIRNEDAWTLAREDRSAAAVYLWGYVAEMTLKAAWFTIEGQLDQDETIKTQDLRRAVKLAKNRYRIPWVGRFHAIRHWADLLVEHRIAIGKPYLNGGFATDIQDHSRRIYDRWRETMRYKKNRPYRREVRVVSDSAQWLLSNSRRL